MSSWYGGDGGDGVVMVVMMETMLKTEACLWGPAGPHVVMNGDRSEEHSVSVLIRGIKEYRCARATCSPKDVRAVTDPRDGRRVALKKLPNVFQSLVSSKRVFRELKMLCFFKHENVSFISINMSWCLRWKNHFNHLHLDDHDNENDDHDYDDYDYDDNDDDSSWKSWLSRFDQ
ncbi:hypothetical protein M0802_002170 [Mischocyttarus mexicanus]|nr:hypothetical protein M0802_002170 [Mischocyttarus mexicanus]